MINLVKNTGFKWRNNNGLYIKGYMDKINSNKSDLINTYSNLEELIEKVTNSTGFFSIVYDTENYVFAAVDRIRSIPLFYAFHDQKIFLSDDPNWICNKINENEMDEISKKEFLLTGYVTGKDTLYQKVKQIQAGEYIIFDKKNKKILTKVYFQLKHQNYFSNNNDQLIKKMEQIHEKVFSRLIEGLDNRTVVIPLSGGYDSRLIVVMLKRLGYENVICFTYGKKNNDEALISKAIANKLNFKWIFIEYTSEKWNQWFQSNEKREYFYYADGLTSIPHIQDVIAVNELKNKKLIPNDSIFIPGHALDFLAGTHIPNSFISNRKYNQIDIFNKILSVHYSLWDDKKLIKKYRSAFIQKINSIIDNKDFYSSEEIIDNYERWIWSQRQAKFIANSVRVYDYYNFEWRMPLWEKEIIEFWEKVDILKRYNRKLFLDYVEKTQAKLNIQENQKNSKLSLIKNLVIKSPLIGKRIIKYRKRKSLFKHPLCWYSLIDESEFNTLKLDKMKNINSYLTYKYFL